MDPTKVLGYCDQIDGLTQQIRDEVASVPPPVEYQPLHLGDDLQVALTAGGAWAIDEGVSFFVTKGFSAPTPETILKGAGENTISGETGAALTIPMSQREVTMEDLTFQSHADVVVQVGKNSSDQNTVELAPAGVRVHRVTVTSHQGKRAFEIDAADVEFRGCDIRDIYDPTNQDSQAIWIGNAPGPVVVEDCYLEAASENMMCGGDSMKIPNCRPTGLTFRRTTFTKPLAWKTAGTPKVKNLFELKDGNDVLVDDCDLFNSWASAQDGYCYTLTPSKGGSLRNVVIKNNRVHNVGGIANIVGKDKSNLNPDRSQISFLGGDYRTNSAEMGGRGIFALVGAGPEFLKIDGITASIDGSSFIDVYDPGMGLLSILNSTWNYGSYGVRLKGYSHGDNVMGAVETIVIEGNTITGAHSQFRERYPNNTYIDSMSRDREKKVDAEHGAHECLMQAVIERMRGWEQDYRI